MLPAAEKLERVEIAEVKFEKRMAATSTNPGRPQTCFRARDGLTMSETIKAPDVRVKRAHEPGRPEDGRRILVDRLWPRGVSKAEADIDEWLKELAPSTELRKWFGHDPARWAEFQRRYARELQGHPEPLARLRKLARKGPLTLVYSARDELHNDAVVLRGVLLGGSSSDGGGG
jgi:uncharacterized protein YeaO (DUF488 family)